MIVKIFLFSMFNSHTYDLHHLLYSLTTGYHSLRLSPQRFETSLHLFLPCTYVYFSLLQNLFVSAVLFLWGLLYSRLIYASGANSSNLLSFRFAAQ